MNENINEPLSIIGALAIYFLWGIPLTIYLSSNFSFPTYLYISFGCLGYLITRKLMF